MAEEQRSSGAGSKEVTRALSAKFVLAVTVGGIIGLGILRNPGEIAAVIPNPYAYLGLWLTFGLFVLLSSAVVAELIGMTPRSGGTYALVRHAYGPYTGFLIGWADWLSFVSEIALKAVVIVEFIAILFPAAMQWQTELGIVITTFFAAFQLRGLALSGAIQEIATAAIGFAVVALALTLFFADPVSASAASSVVEGRTGIRAWSLVAATIIFTYDGWMFAAYFSGEIRGGAGAVARSTIKGVVIVISLYLLINAAMVASVPMATIAGSHLALAAALEAAVSPFAATFVIVAAILILLSHQNLSYMGAPRVLQALAEDGLAIKRASESGARGNPIFAVFLTWGLTVTMVSVGGFEFLMHLFVLILIPIYVALILGVIILRKREPDSDRPYRAWGHPYSTYICLIGWGVITLFQIYAERETALYALGMVAASWPVYLYLNRKTAR